MSLHSIKQILYIYIRRSRFTIKRGVLMMSQIHTANKKTVVVPSRSQKFVTCPRCWTDQRTDRDFCYQCGAEFLYRDEGARSVQTRVIV